MMVCHELGHTLQLGHAAAGADSCMTPVPQLTGPSVSDLTNALLSIPDQQANDSAKSDHKQKKRGSKGKNGGQGHGKKHRH
jgi:hypothetical protein